jgi:predicted RND superfamily exporter protein
MKHATRSERFFGAWVDLVLRHRALFAAASAGVLLFGVYAIVTRMRVQSGVAEILDDGAALETGRGQALLASRAEEESETMLLIAGPVESPAFLRKLRDLTAALRRAELALQDVPDAAPAPDASPPPASSAPEAAKPNARASHSFTEVRSLLDVTVLKSDEDGLARASPVREVGPPGQGQLRLDRALIAQAEVTGKLVDAELRHAIVVVRTPWLSDRDAEVVERTIVAVSRKYDAEDFHVVTVGLPALASLHTEMVLRDTKMLMVLAIGASFIVLLLTFRNVLGVIGPLLVVVQAVAWTFGLMAALDEPVTVIMVYLPILITIMSLGDSVHMQALYREGLAAGEAPRAAIRQAFQRGGVPMVFTTVTTMFGDASLATADIHAIGKMGLLAAFGVGSAMLHTLVTIPLTLSLNTSGRFGPVQATNPLVPRVLAFANGLSRDRMVAGGLRRPSLSIVLGAAVLSLVSVAAATRLEVHQDMLEWLPRGNRLSAAIAVLDRHFDGSNTIRMEVGLKPGQSFQDPANLERLARFQQALRGYREPDTGKLLVGGMQGPNESLRAARRAMRELDGAAAAPPDTAADLGATFSLLEALGIRRKDIHLNEDDSRAQLDVYLKWRPASEYRDFLDFSEQQAQVSFADVGKVRLRGQAVDMIRVVSALMDSLLSSFGTAFLTVTCVVVVFMRSIRLGLLAMVPNALPILIVLGYMAIAGIPIDVHTMMLASIAMGLVVDDTVHFLHHFRTSMEATGDVDAAVDEALSTVGSATLSNGLALIAGFSVYLFAIMESMHRTAYLMIITIVVATAVELLLMPALLRLARVLAMNVGTYVPTERRADGS